MTYARVFQFGNSQVIRLPKEFRLEVDRVEIFRRGEEIVLREHLANAAAMFCQVLLMQSKDNGLFNPYDRHYFASSCKTSRRFFIICHAKVTCFSNSGS